MALAAVIQSAPQLQRRCDQIIFTAVKSAPMCGTVPSLCGIILAEPPLPAVNPSRLVMQLVGVRSALLSLLWGQPGLVTSSEHRRNGLLPLSVAAAELIP